MKFNGFVIDNLESFRKYFNIKQLLEQIDAQVVLVQWVEQLQTTYLDEATVNLINRTKEALWFRYNEEKNPCLTNIDKLSDEFYENKDLFLHLMKKIPKVASADLDEYLNFCYLLALLLRMAAHSSTREDHGVIVDYISNHILKNSVLLSICNFENKYFLCNKNKKICELRVDDRLKGIRTDFAQAVVDEDTGYLGITSDGTLINGSSLKIPELNKAVVKVKLSYNNYVILLEDGTIAHNLLFGKVPSANVIDIALQGDHLVCELVDGRIFSSEKGIFTAEKKGMNYLEEIIND